MASQCCSYVSVCSPWVSLNCDVRRQERREKGRGTKTEGQTKGGHEGFSLQKVGLNLLLVAEPLLTIR